MELPGERESVRKVLSIAGDFGYGNLIYRLKYAWALKLITESGLDVEGGCLGAWLDKSEAKAFGRLSKDNAIKELAARCFLEDKVDEV